MRRDKKGKNDRWVRAAWASARGIVLSDGRVAPAPSALRHGSKRAGPIGVAAGVAATARAHHSDFALSAFAQITGTIIVPEDVWAEAVRGGGGGGDDRESISGGGLASNSPPSTTRPSTTITSTTSSAAAAAPLISATTATTCAQETGPPPLDFFAAALVNNASLISTAGVSSGGGGRGGLVGVSWR